jgi:hypothetical protein
MQSEQSSVTNLTAQSALFDPELPTATDVMLALSSVATQYALNPSADLAKLALGLAKNLSAPEYAETRYIAEVAKKLIMQWSSVVAEFQLIEAGLLPQHNVLQ